MIRILLIDNYDSFTYNVVQYLEELQADVKGVRNDEIDLAAMAALQPAKIVVSPAPSTPSEPGGSLSVVEAFAGEIPLPGICLGRQVLGEAYGGKVVLASEIMHGKTSPVYHRDVGVFQGLKNPLTATRYHSLVLDKGSMPDCLEITAWTENEQGEPAEIMGVRHRTLAVEGVQFHPESILTEQGHELLRNFLLASN